MIISTFPSHYRYTFITLTITLLRSTVTQPAAFNRPGIRPAAPLDSTARLRCRVNDPTFIRRIIASPGPTPNVRSTFVFSLRSIPFRIAMIFLLNLPSHSNLESTPTPPSLPIRQHKQSHVLIACVSSGNASWDFCSRRLTAWWVGIQFMTRRRFNCLCLLSCGWDIFRSSREHWGAPFIFSSLFLLIVFYFRFVSF